MLNFKKKYYLFLIISSIALMSDCRKNIDVPKPELENVFGTWEWVETYGGFGGALSHPLSTGKNIIIEFKKNGVYHEFINGNMSKKLKFKFTEGKSGCSGSNIYNCIEFKLTGLIKKNDPDLISQAIFFISSDTLILNDLCCDGFISTYCRKK